MGRAWHGSPITGAEAMKAAGVVLVALLSTAVAMGQWVRLASQVEGLKMRLAALEVAHDAPSAPRPPAVAPEVAAALRTCELRTEYLHQVLIAICTPDGYGQRLHQP